MHGFLRTATCREKPGRPALNRGLTDPNCAGETDINPCTAKPRAHVQLTTQAFDWHTARFEDGLATCGSIPESEMTSSIDPVLLDPVNDEAVDAERRRPPAF